MLQEGLNNYLYLFHTGTMLILFGLLIFYLVDLYRNEKDRRQSKDVMASGFYFAECIFNDCLLGKVYLAR